MMTAQLTSLLAIKDGGVVMHAIEIQEHARKLYAALGSKAIVEAAQRAKRYEADGATADARTWRKIEQALLQGQGPHVS